ncbi:MULTISPECIES: type II secretion system protein GspD [Pelosinus]|uniref:Type II and III secretion system protein n=2 Tax=Pelosinus fermentans TaxID=365349 RepID=I8TZQ7_9FIRM|nr:MULTISPECIES: secretin N-terminal domain-containing protein [Pelosinus]AJQ27573.1 type II and III secretion system protein [Pelosinus fermentans JBW45]EIW18292.1 type II and III secretion system protein [Pelosinus fermentans B4]EIW24278.1 type II and III secretion system protein [Pelosinus fermentans A11]OAM94276.1 type II and III secretion system protein [Pelosinus fermentans DSM 17108]SDR04898.1 type IV pilus assembly protein PilQ [Pelosinus fermentans]
MNRTHLCVMILLLSITICGIAMAEPQSIDLSFVDEDVRVILHTLAIISNVDIIIDESIKGNITLKLKSTTFENALILITSAKGLSYRKIGESFIIEPVDMGTTEIYKLRYIRAVDIKKTLEPIMNSLKLKAEIDEISNSLIFSGSPTGCARIKILLTDLDVPQQQVVIEAKVVAINKAKTKELGIDWSWDVTPQYAEYSAEQVNIANGVTTIEPGKVTRDTGKGIIQFGRNPEGHPYEFYYQAKINALISNGNAKILASPKVTTINGNEARILIGDHIPVLTERMEDGKTTTTVEYIDTGIKLTYTPTITADGTITAKVHTEVSTPSLVTDIKNYRITTREVESMVCMKDGETMVIGGLIGSEESKTNNKIPFLSELPLIGTLFKSVHNSKVETEVIIFLTAKLVK